MLYDLLHDFYSVNNRLNRALRNDYRTGYNWPPVNVYGNNDEFVVTAKMPGMKKEDVKITLKDNALKIAGTRKFGKDDKENYHIKERPEGDFERSFMIGEKVDADKITAEMKNGLLVIKLPKSREAKPKSITIQ